MGQRVEAMAGLTVDARASVRPRGWDRYAVPEGSTCPPPSMCHTRPIGEFSEAKASNLTINSPIRV